MQPECLSCPAFCPRRIRIYVGNSMPLNLCKRAGDVDHQRSGRETGAEQAQRKQVDAVTSHPADPQHLLVIPSVAAFFVARSSGAHAPARAPISSMQCTSLQWHQAAMVRVALNVDLVNRLETKAPRRTLRLNWRSPDRAQPRRVR